MFIGWKEMRRSARRMIASWNGSVQSGVSSGAFSAIFCRPDWLLADNGAPEQSIRPAAFPGSRALRQKISTFGMRVLKISAAVLELPFRA